MTDTFTLTRAGAHALGRDAARSAVKVIYRADLPRRYRVDRQSRQRRTGSIEIERHARCPFKAAARGGAVLQAKAEDIQRKPGNKRRAEPCPTSQSALGKPCKVAALSHICHSIVPTVTSL